MNKENDIPIATISKGPSLNDSVKGHVKIWQTHKETGKSELVVDKKNLVLYSGATILSYALSGNPGYSINTMYIGYCNSGSFTAPTIDLANSQPLNSLNPATFGYLRVPLSFAPSYVSQTNYVNNTAIYTAQISSGTAYFGPTFTSGTSTIYGLALVAAPNPTNGSQDVYFSRLNFSNLLYSSTYNLTISWGVNFIAS